MNASSIECSTHSSSNSVTRTQDTEWHTCDLCHDGRIFKGSRGLSQHRAWHRRRLQTGTTEPAHPTIATNPQQLPVNHDIRSDANTESLSCRLCNLKESVAIVKRIPRGARVQVARSLAETISDVVKQNSFISWEKLFTFSYRILHGHNKKQTLTSQIRQNITNDSLPRTHQTYISNSFSKKIETKIADGDIRGASRLLFSQDTMAPADNHTLVSLKERHPNPLPDIPDAEQPDPNQPNLEASIGHVIYAISSFPGGSSGGIDGLTPQHLKDLTSQATGDVGRQLVSAIVELANLMLSGNVNADIVPILYGANLCALKKKDGGIRPIAIGMTFRRLVSKLCCRSINNQFKLMFEPTQLGFGCKGGCEAAVHAARNFLKIPETEVLLKIDVKNAFNSVNRTTFLNEIAQHSPQIHKYLWQCYSKPSKLFFKNNELSSSSGCQQGDPLGPALFSIAIHNIIVKLKSKFNVWYLDDGTMGGDADTVSQDLNFIIQKFSEIGLTLNFNKCELFITENFKSNTDSILNKFNLLAPNIKTINQENLTLLGSPIFGQSFSSFFDTKLQHFDNILTRLLEIKSHLALYLFRYCLFAPKFIYYLRSCPIWKFREIILKIDGKIKQNLELILNISFDDKSWSQATLPINFGGLGIRKIESLALPAFLASSHSNLDLIGKILSPSIRDVEVLYLREAKQVWLETSSSDLPTNECIQKLWDTPLLKQEQSKLLDLCQSDEDRARLKATYEKESGMWLKALPSKKIATLLDNNTLRISVCLRLGLKICDPHRCPCGKTVDSLGRHGLSCPKSAGRFYRHCSINSIIHRSLASISIPSTLEPRGLARDDGKRPDGLTLVPWSMGQCLVWDATCIDTFALTHLQRTSVRAGAAAEQAQHGKRQKYECLTSDYIFLPFAVETMGPWGTEAKGFYKAICPKLIETTGDPRAGSYFLQRVSIAVQRGNAASIMGTMPTDNGMDEFFYL